MTRQSPRVRAERRRGAATTGPAAAIKDRQEALALMNQKCLKKLNHLEKGLADTRSANLRFYYRIGQEVLEVRNNPDEYQGSDGTSGLKLIERAISMHARSLRKAALFAETYSEEELAYLDGLYNTETGFQLHYGHVSFLLSLKTPTERRNFAHEACSQMWDPGALHQAIKRQLRRGPSHGNRHKLPATVLGQIRQIAEYARTWIGKYDQVWDGEQDSVLGNLGEVPSDDVTAELLETVVTAQNAVQEMINRGNGMLPKLSRIVEKFRGCLDAREKAAASKAAAAEAKTKAAGTRRERVLDLGTNGAATRAGRAARRARQSA